MVGIYSPDMTDERRKYLDGLCEDYGVAREAVYALADLLGQNEDYDGLVTELEDLQEMDFTWIGEE